MQLCPYCGFKGTRQEVDNHIVYMTAMVKDRAHQSLTGFTSAAPSTWKLA